MRFKIDENIPVEVCDALRTDGHDVHTVPEEDMTGADDATLMARVAEEQRVMLTLDKGIADVRTYPPQDYAGIVLFRPDSAGRESVAAFILEHMPGLLTRELAGRLFIVSAQGVRMR